jgi:hypothetical protein
MALSLFALALEKASPAREVLRIEFERAGQAALAKAESVEVSEQFLDGLHDVLKRLENGLKPAGQG